MNRTDLIARLNEIRDLNAGHKTREVESGVAALLREVNTRTTYTIEIDELQRDLIIKALTGEPVPFETKEEMELLVQLFQKLREVQDAEGPDMVHGFCW